MTPPRWLDEHGHPRPTRPCPRCGRAAPVLRCREDQLRLLGWRLYGEGSFVNWCGHKQEFVVVPEGEGWCRVVSVMGEAR